MDKVVKDVSIDDLVREYKVVEITHPTIKREILGFIIDQRTNDGFVRLIDIKTIVNLHQFYKNAPGDGFDSFLEINE